jgi:hypothetical protein
MPRGGSPKSKNQGGIMSISIDTASIGYECPGGSHREHPSLTPSALGQKISNIETKHPDLSLPAYQNSRLTEFYSESDDIPDISGLNLTQVKHILNDEKVIPLLS